MSLNPAQLTQLYDYLIDILKGVVQYEELIPIKLSDNKPCLSVELVHTLVRLITVDDRYSSHYLRICYNKDFTVLRFFYSNSDTAAYFEEAILRKNAPGIVIEPAYYDSYPATYRLYNRCLQSLYQQLQLQITKESLTD